MEKESLVGFYKRYYNESKEKYEKVIVLLQKGTFYEIYDVDGNAYKMSDLLNIQMTRESRTRENTAYCGFPMNTHERHVDRILNEGYTIVYIHEVGEYKDKDKNKIRKIIKIVRPSTNLDANNENNNSICMIYIEECKGNLYTGISYIDLITGNSSVIEYGNDGIWENIYEFLDIYNPSEVIIRTKNLQSVKKDFIINYLDLETKNYEYSIRLNDINKVFYQISYQNDVLNKIFQVKDQIISPIEYLELNMYQLATISYVLLLQFIYDCYPNILTNINKPHINEIDSFLILDYNTITQLNLVNQGHNNTTGYKSVYDVLNKCSTVGGRHLLEERLKKPLKDKEEINKRLNIIDNLIQNKPVYEKISEELKNGTNINKQVRKLIIQEINKYELNSLFKNLEILMKLLPLNVLEKCIEEVIVEELINDYNKTFTNGNINKGIYDDLDDLRNKYDAEYSKIVDITKDLANITEDSADNFKISQSDKEGYYITTTKTRARKIKKDYEVRIMTSNAKVSSKGLREASDNLLLLTDKIDKLEKEKFKEYILQLKDHSKLFEDSAFYLNELDYYKSCAKVAMKYNYCRPVVKSSNEKQLSFIKASKLRHCLVERLCNDAYVPNDVVLNNKKNGMLLYGLNCAGKTTYAKAVSIALIMAQCGMYVPAQTFEFGIFNKIMTRITGNDNLFKGQSTFAVEMSELNSILRKANNRCLVVGDEICKGTDSESGGGIVGASLIHLCKLGVPFIFATHLHNIMQLEEIKAIKTLRVCHLEVVRNGFMGSKPINPQDNEVCSTNLIIPKDGKLVYNRTLKEGQGDTQYGIEVAGAMGIDKDILKTSLSLRRKLSGEKEHIIEPKRSRYHKDVFMDMCEVCGGKAEATHHKSFQCHAVNGFINEKNKEHLSIHDKSNLLVVCNKCHQNIHSDCK